MGLSIGAKVLGIGVAIGLGLGGGQQTTTATTATATSEPPPLLAVHVEAPPVVQLGASVGGGSTAASVTASSPIVQANQPPPPSPVSLPAQGSPQQPSQSPPPARVQEQGAPSTTVNRAPSAPQPSASAPAQPAPTPQAPPQPAGGRTEKPRSSTAAGVSQAGGGGASSSHPNRRGTTPEQASKLLERTNAESRAPAAESRRGGKAARGSSTAVLPPLQRIVEQVPTPARWLIALLCALALLLLLRSALARLEARRIERQREELAEAVAALQAALLPASGESINGVEVSIAFQSAHGPAAGGDFCDCFPLEGGKVGVVVGDVNGHGEEALPKTALLHFTLRTYLSAGLSPRQALAAAATALEPQLDGNLATALLAVVDPERLTLTYAAAGHPEPLVCGQAACREPVAASPPLGSGLRTGLRQTVLELRAGSTVCFFTDGVIDAAMEQAGQPGEQLAAALARQTGALSAGALLAELAAGSRQRDDMSACLLKLPGDPDRGGDPATLLVEELAADAEVAGSARPALFLTGLGLDCERTGLALRRVSALCGNGAVALLRVSWPEPGRPQVVVAPEPPPSAAVFASAHDGEIAA